MQVLIHQHTLILCLCLRSSSSFIHLPSFPPFFPVVTLKGSCLLLHLPVSNSSLLLNEVVAGVETKLGELSQYSIACPYKMVKPQYLAPMPPCRSWTESGTCRTWSREERSHILPQHLQWKHLLLTGMAAFHIEIMNESTIDIVSYINYYVQTSNQADVEDWITAIHCGMSEIYVLHRPIYACTFTVLSPQISITPFPIIILAAATAISLQFGTDEVENTLQVCCSPFNCQ